MASNTTFMKDSCRDEKPTLNERRLCLLCETDGAEWMCQDCDYHFCGNCMKLHNKISSIKDHTFLEVRKVQSETDCTNKASKKVHQARRSPAGQKHDTNHNTEDEVEAKVAKLTEEKARSPGAREEKLTEEKARQPGAREEKLTDEKARQPGAREEKLTDTRLLIQRMYDESLEEMASRYECLMDRLKKEYERLRNNFKSLVDAELEKLNDAIMAERAKQIVQKTLVKAATASNIQEQVRSATDFEPLVTSNAYRISKDSLLEFDAQLVLKFVAVSTNFHGRYQLSITKPDFNGPSVKTTIDIELEVSAELPKGSGAYRMNIGFDKIVVCFWDMNIIHVYNADGRPCRQLHLGTDCLIDAPSSALPVSADHIVVASSSGLVILNVNTPSDVTTISTGAHYDVVLAGNTIYALRGTGFIEVLQYENGAWQKERSIPVAPTGTDVSAFATITTTGDVLMFCNGDGKVHWFSFVGEPVRIVTAMDEYESGDIDAQYLCAVDVDGRMLLSVGGQLVLQRMDGHREFIRLDGVTHIDDVVFNERTYSFWILCKTNGSGQKIIQYSL